MFFNLITQHEEMQQVPYKNDISAYYNSQTYRVGLGYRRPVKDEFCWQHQFK